MLLQVVESEEAVSLPLVGGGVVACVEDIERGKPVRRGG